VVRGQAEVMALSTVERMEVRRMVRKFYLLFSVGVLLVALNCSCKQKDKGTNQTGSKSPQQQASAKSPQQEAGGGSETVADPRERSEKKLSEFGKALFLYANDNEDKLPDSLDWFSSPKLNAEEIQWLLDNVKYLGGGVTINNDPGTVLAYDKTLLPEGEGTNVLFLDSHVEFAKPDKLKELGIEAEKF